jgi:DNA (cytosine-5)-methyltransferase 1
LGKHSYNPCGLRWLKSKRKPVAPRKPIAKIRIVDLFCGCGGLSLGIAEAGRERNISVEIAVAIDADVSALQVFQANFGTACKRAECKRIEKLFQGKLGGLLSQQERDLASAVGQVDLLVAGPPCQGHSDLNNHSRRLDNRNALYARVARAAEVLNPAVVIIENVIGVTNDRGHVVSRTRKHLEGLGYTIESIRIDSRDLGMAQRRRRHFLIAFDKSLKPLWKPMAEANGARWTVGKVLAGLEDVANESSEMYRTPSKCTARNQKRIDFLFDTDKYDLPDSKRPLCHKDGNHTYKAVYGRLRWDGIANTITSGFGSMGQGRYVHPTRRRMITPHEAARLQGFPDWFRFGDVESRGSLQTMIGNAVVPRVAAWLTRHLLITTILKPRQFVAVARTQVFARRMKKVRAGPA